MIFTFTPRLDKVLWCDSKDYVCHLSIEAYQVDLETRLQINIS